MFYFHPADYVVGVIILTIPVGIGVVFAIRDANRATREEYLLGGRQMSMLPVALSLFITFQSAISLIGIPSDIYTYGSRFVYLIIGICLSYLVGVVTMVPLTYPLKITSLYAYLDLRFKSRAVRLLCTLMSMIQTVLYMAIALLAPALALQASAGIPLWLSVVIFGAIGTIYTVIGGIKSVIWTDAFQTIIVFIGIFAIIIAGCQEVGSIGEIWRLAEEGGRLDLGYVNPDPRVRHTHLGCLLGGVFMWLPLTFNQSTMQRIASLNTTKKAKVAYLLNIPLLLVYLFILSFVGIIIYSYNAYKRCDPLGEGFITNGNQLAPYFVLETMHYMPGMAGLYVSTLCCGALSTLSSGINALAANTVEDFLARPLSHVKEATATFITKIIVLVYGILIIGLAYLAKAFSGPVTQMSVSVAGALGSPVLGMFLLGALVPWVNKYGATFGAVVAFGFNLWISFGQRLYGRTADRLPPIVSDSCFVNHSSINYNESTTMSPTTAFYNPSTEFLYDNYNQSSVSGPSYINTTAASAKKEYGFFFYDLSYEWYGLTGTLITVIIGLIGSAVTRRLENSGKTKDPLLLFPFVRRFWFGEENLHPVLRGESSIESIELNFVPPTNGEVTEKCLVADLS